MRLDDYALGARRREECYREAFRSEAFWSWLRSLTPMQRVRARELGLLAPHVEGDSRALSLEELSPAQIPVCQPVLPGEEAPEAEPQEGRSQGESSEQRDLSPQERRMLRDFLHEEGRPALRAACLRYLCGYGTCAGHARRLGISKQLFHYHVRKLQRRLGLPRAAGQRSARVQEACRKSNIRKFFIPEK